MLQKYLAEKKVLDDQIRATEEDIERITKELSKVPSEADLETLEEMAGKIVQSLGMNLAIPDTEKRRIMELLNIKVIMSPDREIRLEVFFSPESDGLLCTSYLWRSLPCSFCPSATSFSKNRSAGRRVLGLYWPLQEWPSYSLLKVDC